MSPKTVSDVLSLIRNILQYASLFNPVGEKTEASSVSSDTFTLVKITEFIPGTWKLITEGVPGDSIKINMIYNTNLGIDVNVEPDSLMASINNPISVTATLKSGTISANSNDHYSGYSALLQIMNAYGEVIETQPMDVSDGAFAATYQPEEKVERQFSLNMIFLLAKP